MFLPDYLPYLQGLLTVSSIYTLAVISPGSCFAMVLRNSLLYSRKAGIFTALGVSTGILLHATYTIIGLGALIRHHELLFKAVQAAGALYLLYIGMTSFKRKAPLKTYGSYKRSVDTITSLNAYKMGFLTNILNPMVIVFFLSIFSSVIEPSTPFTIQVLYTFVMAAIALAWFISVAFFLTFPRLRNQFQKMGYWLDLSTGAILILFSIKIIINLMP